MLKILKEFWKEEDGLGTVEIIVILIVLLGIAFLFRTAITNFVTELLAKITGSQDDITLDSEPK